MEINPQIIQKNGKNEFVILAYEEFIKIQEKLNDYEDLRLLRAAKQKEKNAPAIPLESIKKMFKI